MSEAIRAKTAAERATIAANFLKGAKERNEDFGRPFDDCFEMGDAEEVMRILIERATDDLALRIAVRRNWKTAPRELTAAVNQMSTACDDFRALARGDDPEVVIHRIADFRSEDKSDPVYYARLTVTKARAHLHGLEGDATFQQSVAAEMSRTLR
jgi:hypothetical protein